MKFLQIKKPNLNRLTPKKHPLYIEDENSINPFFIIGSGRSGNTLLRRILNEHSNLYIPPETYVIGESIKLFKRYQTIEWKDLVKLIYATYIFHPQFEYFNVDNFTELYNQACNIEPNARSLSNIFKLYYINYKELHNETANIWGDKTPLNTLYINDIYEVFPKAKYIHIHRNPYDAIVSYVKSGRYKDYKNATIRWKNSIEIASNFGKNHPSSYFEIKYEDLVENPELYIKKTCGFLGIEFEKSMLQISKKSNNLGDVHLLKHHKNVMMPITTNNIGKGLKSLSQNDKSIINKILKQSSNQKIISMIN